MSKASDIMAFVLILAVVVLLFWVFSVPSSVSLGNIGSIVSKPAGGSAGSESNPLTFYSDFSGSSPVEQIDWGTVMPASSKDSTVYVRNQAQRELGLSFETDNWTPANASDYITLSWDAPQSLSVQAGEIKPIIFTLTVASKITGITEFSFDIVIWYD